jgi:hypothetical protein
MHTRAYHCVFGGYSDESGLSMIDLCIRQHRPNCVLRQQSSAAPFASEQRGLTI